MSKKTLKNCRERLIKFVTSMAHRSFNDSYSMRFPTVSVSESIKFVHAFFLSNTLCVIFFTNIFFAFVRSMGQFLDKPKVEKHNSGGKNEDVRYGLGSMQGWR